MKQLYIFLKTVLPVIILALMLAMPNSALADQPKSSKQKSGISSGVRSALTTLRNKNVYTNKTAATTRTIADTTTKIRSLGKSSNGGYKVVINLANDESNLDIGVYNILGRKLIAVWNGAEKKGDGLEYEIQAGSLPDGMYICVVQGKDFRLAEKFVVSR
jgi:hypothetical protein